MVRVGTFLLAIALITGMAGCAPRPTQIRDWYDLDAIRHHLWDTYILMNDLDSTTAGYEELAGPSANMGYGWEPIQIYVFDSGYTGLCGTFDGQGHEIRDLFISDPAGSGCLFGSLEQGGVIKDIGLVNVTVTWAGGAGGLVGMNAGTVSNSYSTGSMTCAGGAGGLVGMNVGTVSNSYSTSAVTGGSDDVGGLVGWNAGTVSDSYSTGNVTGSEDVGGLVGRNWGTVSNSYYSYDEVPINGEHIVTIGALPDEDFDQWLAQGRFLDVNERLSQEDGYCLINSVSDFKQLLAFGQNATLKFRLTSDLDLDVESNFHIPYLAGEFDGNGHRISHMSFNLDFVYCVGLFGYLAPGGKVSQVGVDNVNITGRNYVGALVGWNKGTVDNSYSTGGVSGNAGIGGLVGRNTGTVSNSYSTASVTGNVSVGGLVGRNAGSVNDSFWDTETSGQNVSDGGTGKTTAEMKDITTFIGAFWDIIAVANPGIRNLAYIWNIVDDVTYPFLSWQPVS